MMPPRTRGSKRPSPDPEDDALTRRPKRTKSQDDTKAAGKGNEGNQKGKGKAREVPASRSPSPAPPAFAEYSARLESLLRASTSNQPTTSARAEEQEAEIARLSALVAEQAAQLGEQAGQLGQVREALKCGICFDPLDRPYALSPCGHVGCYGCLLRWFVSDRNDPTSAVVQDPVATIVNGTGRPTAMTGNDNDDRVEGDNTNEANTRAVIGRARTSTRTSAQPNPESFPRSWTTGLGIHTNSSVRRYIFPSLSPGRAGPPPTRGTQRALSPEVQRSPIVSYVHKTKVCPVCRAKVTERPLEMFAIRSAVEALGEDAKTPPRSQLTPASDRPNPRNPKNDPWNNVFSPLPTISSRSPPPPPFPLDPSHFLPVPLPSMSSFGTALAPFLNGAGATEPGGRTFVSQADGLFPIGGGRWERVERAEQDRELGRRATLPYIPVTVQEPEAPSGSTPPAIARALSLSRSRRGQIENEGGTSQPGPSHATPAVAAGPPSPGTQSTEDPLSFGVRGSDGVYRCIDCTVFGIVNGECVSCGRVYPGHPHREGDDHDAEVPAQAEEEGSEEGRGETNSLESVEPPTQDPLAPPDATRPEPPSGGQGAREERAGDTPKMEKEGEEYWEECDAETNGGRSSRGGSSSRGTSTGPSSSADSIADSGCRSNPSPPSGVRRLRSGRTYPTVDAPRSRSGQPIRRPGSERDRRRTRVLEACETRRAREKQRQKGLVDSDSEADVEEVSRACAEVSDS